MTAQPEMISMPRRIAKSMLRFGRNHASQLSARAVNHAAGLPRPVQFLREHCFPGRRPLLFTLNRLAASNALAALRLRNILPGVLQATLTSHRSLISNLKSGGPHTLPRCQPHRPGSRHQNACAVAPYSGYRQHRRRNLARPGGEVLQGRDHRRQRFNCCVRWQKGRMWPLGHVWTAPWQALSDVLQHWSGAVTCPAC
jgi:hypothetical protein